MASVLLLNADAQPLSLMPLSTISWQNAVKAYFQNKIKILKEYDLEIHSPSLTLKMPSIVMLTRYHKIPRRAKFTRRNLFIRDDYQCQYCGHTFNPDKLTMDHVIPRSKGGKISWSNVVSACQPCNTRKGSKLINPRQPAYAPNFFEINNKARNYNIIIPDAEWQNYIHWPEEKLTIIEPTN